MAESEPLCNPWLVAVWSGMGGVGLNAGGYLVEKLGATLIGEVSSEELFEPKHVDVKAGLVRPTRLPRSMFFQWKDPKGRRDLLIYIGESQPAQGGYALCRRIVEFAAERNVERLFTFAAMATQLHPSKAPRVFGVATDNDALVDLRHRDVEILKEGQISGLNGVLLAAGAEEGLTGTCLMGELPYFAVGVANPRASQAVLEVFSAISGIEVDLGEIREQAAQVEQGLLQLLEQLKEAAQHKADVEESFDVAEETSEPTQREPSVDESTRRRIEALFEAARENRARAFELKEFLDRQGLFERYEDRFLDLFKKAE